MTAAPIDAVPHVLIALAPHLSAAEVTAWTAALTPTMQASGIVTERRIAMALGQWCEETGGFTELVEDLNYSVKRLCQVWPERFPTSAVAAPFAHNPRALGSKVYADRLGNGSEASGDGFLFRGRGPTQLTGRALYEAFFASMRRPVDPDWLATLPGGAGSACWYWTTRGRLNDLSDDWAVSTVTERINGGLENLPARIAACNQALAVLAALRPAAPSAPPPATPVQRPPPPDDPADTRADDLNAEQLATIAKEQKA